ncbi:MAG: glycosyltransferase family 9 protein [Deltaproteobacteria bacterium]|jgi:ADP-heptose:LPS heptosyltransferase|nr:glycosyltransferase family 9 protein [Deltaproteobacteria bacterium]
MAPYLLEDGEKVLIVRLSAVGDTVQTLKLGAGVRKLFPKVRLGWAVEEESSPFIVENPLLDWWLVVRKGFLKSPSRLWELKKDLRKQEINLAFDPQSLTKSAVLAFLSGAPRRAGFARGQGRELAPFLNNILARPKSRRVSERYLELLEAVKPGSLAALRDDDPEIPLPKLTGRDQDLLEGFLSREALKPHGYLLFAPGASLPAKRWPLERYAALGRGLFLKTGEPAVLLGHGDLQREALRPLLKKEGLILAPDLGLLGVAELIRRSRLTLGSDSFPGHLADALKVPAVMLFAISDPFRAGPRGPLSLSLYKDLNIARSMRSGRKFNERWILSLDSSYVEEEVLKLLERIKASAASPAAGKPPAAGAAS